MSTLEQMANAEMATSETPQQVIRRLAGLSTLEYELCRDEEAGKLGARVSVLDTEVKAERDVSQNNTDMFAVIDPWHLPVNGAELLSDIAATVRRFIVCKPETVTATALWSVFTWLIDSAQIAPLVVITAPEKRCGKSTALALINKLVCRPLSASNISPAAVFRVIEAHSPTLLIDEVDSFLKDNEELRGVINSGHTRDAAYVIRTVGDSHEPTRFSTWGCKALSGIGNVPETIADRAIMLELRRKLPTETVERLRHADHSIFTELTRKALRFSTDAASEIKRARPLLPDALNDRAQDNWEPLLAIADFAGGDWPQLARQAALKISGTEHETISLTSELLSDIREIFDAQQLDRISTAQLISELTTDDLKPWATYNRGKPLSPRQLAKRLEEYEIKSRTIRVYANTCKGFYRDQFSDAFERYLSVVLPDKPVTASQPFKTSEIGLPDIFEHPSHAVTGHMPANSAASFLVTDKSDCDGDPFLSVTRKPYVNSLCDVVTDKSDNAGDITL